MRTLALPVVFAAVVGLTGVAVPSNAAETAGAASAGKARISAPAAELFDDFSYDNSSDPRISERGWTVRTGEGGPGVPGAGWSAANVTFPAIGGHAGQALQLEASTNGAAAGTTQAEMHHQRKFFEGTYAARVRFSDAPVSGPDGDQIVQTFFTITPLEYPNDPDYGEIDFEYLPNGGWGLPGSTLHTTTWETYQLDPWQADNAHDTISGSQAGWHDLVIHVSGGHVRYFLDGVQVADHGGRYYPETPMSLNLNHWFIDGGLIDSSAARAYVEQVDYVYFSKDEVVSPSEVSSRVDAFRGSSVEWKDSVDGAGDAFIVPRG